MVNKYKKQRKASKKKHVKGTKIFLKKKKKKDQYHRERDKNLSKEEKQKSRVYEKLLYKYIKIVFRVL